MRELPSALRIEVARSLAQAEAHLGSWRRLEAHALDDNFYFSPDFLLPSLRWLMPDEDVRIVFVYEQGDGGRLVACAPFQLLPGVDGLPLTTLASLLSPHGYLGTPLLHRDRAADAVAALTSWLDDDERSWKMVCWRRIPLESRTWQLVEEEMRSRGRPPVLRHAFEREIMTPVESFEAYLAGLSGGRRRRYRRSWAAFEALGTFEVRVHRDCSRSADLARDFMALEGQGWKLREGNALIQTQPDRSFFTELVESAASSSRLHFVELLLNGKPVAMGARFVTGTTSFAFKLGYDQQYAKLSPGLLLEVECTKAFLAAGLDFADSGTSGKSWAAPYWTRTAPIGELVVATPGLLSRATLGLFPVVRALKRAAAKQAARYAPPMDEREPRVA